MGMGEPADTRDAQLGPKCGEGMAVLLAAFGTVIGAVVVVVVDSVDPPPCFGGICGRTTGTREGECECRDRAASKPRTGAEAEDGAGAGARGGGPGESVILVGQTRVYC